MAVTSRIPTHPAELNSRIPSSSEAFILGCPELCQLLAPLEQSSL